MKKVYSRIKNMFERNQINKAYILGSSCIEVNMYKKHIHINTDLDKSKIILLNKNNIKNIDVNKDIIILCGRWYLNKLIDIKELQLLLKKCSSIPIDELE